MKRLFALVLTAFVFAFFAPAAIQNAAAQSDDAATSAADKAMKADNAASGDEQHQNHGAPANESNKTNKDKGRKHPGHHKGKHHHKHHKKAEKGADAAAPAASDAGAMGTENK